MKNTTLFFLLLLTTSVMSKDAINVAQDEPIKIDLNQVPNDNINGLVQNITKIRKQPLKSSKMIIAKLRQLVT